MVTKKTSKRCESETRFQKTWHIMRSGHSPQMRAAVSFRGLLNILSLEDSVSFLVGPTAALTATLALPGKPPGFEDCQERTTGEVI